MGYTDEKDNIYTDLPVIIFDDFTTSSQYVDFKFKCKSSAMKILRARDNFDIKYVYEVMQTINYCVAGHERHWISKYSLLPVKIPKYEEQKAIVEIISAKDREIELLQKSIDQEKQKKKALMQLLLSGIVRVG